MDAAQATVSLLQDWINTPSWNASQAFLAGHPALRGSDALLENWSGDAVARQHWPSCGSPSMSPPATYSTRSSISLTPASSCSASHAPAAPNSSPKPGTQLRTLLQTPSPQPWPPRSFKRSATRPTTPTRPTKPCGLQPRPRQPATAATPLPCSGPSPRPRRPSRAAAPDRRHHRPNRLTLRLTSPSTRPTLTAGQSSDLRYLGDAFRRAGPGDHGPTALLVVESARMYRRAARVSDARSSLSTPCGFEDLSADRPGQRCSLMPPATDLDGRPMSRAKSGNIV
jgi:hypothetical protein